MKKYTPKDKANIFLDLRPIKGTKKRYNYFRDKEFNKWDSVDLTINTSFSLYCLSAAAAVSLVGLGYYLYDKL